MTIPFPSTVEGPILAAVGRLLVVDDDPAVRRFVDKVLKREGHRVDQASSVDAAICLLRDADYDVVLIDLEMPVRNGLELLDVIREQEISSVPVLLTGTTNVGAAVGGMKRGAFDYISKPVDLDSLRWTTARAVGAAQARRREQQLKRIATDWVATFDACPELLMVVDPDGRILRANAAVSRQVQIPIDAITGRRVEEVFPDGLGHAILAGRMALPEMRQGPAVKLFDSVLGVHFLLSVNPIRVDGPSPGMVVVAHDVSELVDAETERARLFRRLITAEDDERARMARELHDGIGQSLVSLSVGLATVVTMPEGSRIEDRVQQLARVAAECLEECRRMAHGVRPTVLEDLGLTTALSRLAESVTTLHDVKAELVLPTGLVDELPSEMAFSIYRIVQEALANVIKHAHARTVDIVLEASSSAVRVSITDDGTGFEVPSQDHATRGFGISGMSDRTLMFGGSFRIESMPDRGTTIDIQIPLEEVSHAPYANRAGR